MLMTHDWQSNHISVPFQSFEPFLEELTSLVPLAHFFTQSANAFDLFKFFANTTKCYSFLCLMHSHAHFDQSLHLSSEQLITKVRLVRYYFLTQRPCHFDSFILQEDLGRAASFFDHIFLWKYGTKRLILLILLSAKCQPLWVSNQASEPILWLFRLIKVWF